MIGPPAESEYAVDPVGVLDNQPISPKLRHELSLNGKFEFDHASERSLADHHVIEHRRLRDCFPMSMTRGSSA